MSHDSTTAEIARLLDHFSRMVQLDTGMPAEDTPIGMLTREFFANNWANCRRGLLRKTNRIRVAPEPSQAPRVFKFEIDCPYKRKQNLDAPVELIPGPVRGTIYLRPDIYINTEDPAIAVALDQDQSLFHPNYSRRKGFICLGELPEKPFPFPLDLLLENLVFPIVSYQNRRPVHAFDEEAAAYFALDPEAMQGLESVEPLY